MRRLQAAGDLAAEPKQAWTPVAEFAAAGVDAVNFGPGATAYAHRRDEQVEIAALVRCYEVLARLPERYRLAMRLSPVLAAQTTYPFVRLDEAKRRAVERGIELIDFGIGDPRERTEPFIEEALAEALPATAGYPRARGLPELRDAIARWCERRFGVLLDAETRGHPEPRLQGGDLLARPAARRPGGRQARGARDRSRLPGPRARRRLRARGDRPPAAPRGERLPPRPRRRSRTTCGAARRSSG